MLSRPFLEIVNHLFDAASPVDGERHEFFKGCAHVIVANRVQSVLVSFRPKRPRNPIRITVASDRKQTLPLGSLSRSNFLPPSVGKLGQITIQDPAPPTPPDHH